MRDAKKVDARTDIWSLGLILHELLSASPAFEGTTLPGVCAAIAADPPAALRLKRPDVPVELEAIVLKCLEKDPAKRFQSARELSDRLAPWSGRPESRTLGPLSDQTIRSSPVFELTGLHDGSTLPLSSDNGTLASAVFTQSGTRVVAAAPKAHSKSAATEAPPEATPRASKHRLWLGLGAALLLGGSIYLVLPRSAPMPTPAPANAPSFVAQPPPAPASFAVQIESTPNGAEVFEGEERLGTTPMRITVTTPPRTFSVRKAGFLPYTLVQGPSAGDTRVLAELSAVPAPIPPASAAPPRKAAIAKPTTAKPTSSGDIFMQR